MKGWSARKCIIIAIAIIKVGVKVDANEKYIFITFIQQPDKISYTIFYLVCRE